jgi:hypothetical protein
MKRRARQFVFLGFFIFAASLPLFGALSPGRVYALNFVDVDGRKLSTADGHVTVVVLSSRSDANKARVVGDRIPGYCLGNPTYRMITVIGLGQSRSRPLRMLLTSIVRRRLDAEAQRLQPRYAAKKLARNPRSDLFAVADFDGSAVSQLGSSPSSLAFTVLVFARNGQLLRQWNDVPSAGDLAAALK